MVDAGAARALREHGASLLPAGITLVDGAFHRGATVRIFDGDGREVARGWAQYRATDLRLITGRPSSQIEDVLGLTYGSEPVHRDNIVLLHG